MKKRAWLLLFWWGATSSLLLAQENLSDVLQNQQWDKLPSLFEDSSYQQAIDLFREAKFLFFSALSPTEIHYKAKYNKFAETGVIRFKRSKTQYSNLLIENQLKPLSFIEKFRKYQVENKRIQLGDAEIIFNSGSIYEALPRYNHATFIFEGNWQFRITPSDLEERLTLRRFFKNETFEKNCSVGLFIFPDSTFLDGLKPESEVDIHSITSEAPVFSFFQKQYGFFVEEANEYWYLSTSALEHVVLFDKDKKSFYFFDYNEAANPDTQLRTTDNDRFYLYYNRITTPRILFSSDNALKDVKVNIYYNPQTNFVSGTASLYFHNPLSLYSLDLHPSLNLRMATTGESDRINFFRKGDNYYASFPSTDCLNFFYNGFIQSDQNFTEVVKVVTKNNEHHLLDEFQLFSKNVNFYPSSGNEYFNSLIRINIPEKYSCLASGHLEKIENQANRSSYVFSCQPTKGISMVIGDFSKRYRVEAKIPVNVYFQPNLKNRKFITEDSIRERIDFLAELFGPLDMPEINLLIRRWQDEGGISNRGFVVFNVKESKIFFDFSSRLQVADNPLILENRRDEFLLHELSHQWWGGLVSWDTFRDQWITEGTAHFSSMLFFQKRNSDARFENILEKSVKWVLKYKDTAPIIYGRRIANLDAYNAFQSIVYTKSALVLFMLQEIIGPEELLSRLGSLLTKFKFSNINTHKWIDHLSQKDSLICRFLKQWIYSRDIPVLSYSAIESPKGVQITLEQENTDFVFPIWIDVTTERGNRKEKIIIQTKTQNVIIPLNGKIVSLRLDNRCSPIIIKK